MRTAMTTLIPIKLPANTLKQVEAAVKRTYLRRCCRTTVSTNAGVTTHLSQLLSTTTTWHTLSWLCDMVTFVMILWHIKYSMVQRNTHHSMILI